MLNSSIFGSVTPMSNGRCPWILLYPTLSCLNEDRLIKDWGRNCTGQLILTHSKYCKFGQFAKRIKDNPLPGYSHLQVTLLETKSFQKRVGCFLLDNLCEKQSFGALSWRQVSKEFLLLVG